MEATPEQLAAFGHALKVVLDDRGIDYKDLAVELTRELSESVSPSSVSQWISATHEPARRRVFAIERLLKLRPGRLSRHLDYLPVNAKDVRSVEDALESDGLSEEALGMLRVAYRSARKL